MQYVHENAVKGTYVSLMADYPADKLYEKFGFQSTEPHSMECIFYFKYSKRRPRQCNEDAFCCNTLMLFNTKVDNDSTHVLVIHYAINTIW